MAHPVKDSFLDLERHLQLLEDNIAKLRKSLQHWQTWSAEYEGLKEEILAIPSPTRAKLLEVSNSYSGELLTKTEIEDILGTKTPRQVDQVLNILDRRLDYVQQNVTSVEKMLSQAEEKLTAATVVTAPEVRNEEGLPIMEIVEELDEDGEVISGRVVEPGSARPQLIEVMQKAGIKDFPALEDNYSSANKIVPETSVDSSAKKVDGAVDGVDTAAGVVGPAREVAETAKKGVTFSEDTKPSSDEEKSRTARRLEEIMNISKNQEEPISGAIIPEDESPEDARLRREMLQYNLPGMGAVVAEMEIEENGFTDDEEYEDEDETTSTDDEDDFGRSTSSVIDEEMHRRMMELEQKLGVRMMENVGQKPDIDIANESSGQVLIKDSDPGLVPTSQAETSGKKKGVRFAEELDISPVPAESPSTSTKSRSTPSKPPVTDIVERATPVQQSTLTSSSSQSSKPSRFKASRNSVPAPAIPFAAPTTTRTVPTGPTGTTLAPTVVERTVDVPDVSEPDEFDPALLHQQVATDYYKIRNRMIQRQGGFLKEEIREDGKMELDEEEGGPKRVSKFMAARLGRG